MTGKQTEYHSIPYWSITHFPRRDGGHFDRNAELKIWLSGTAAPIEKTFTKGVDIYQVQAILTQFVAMCCLQAFTIVWSRHVGESPGRRPRCSNRQRIQARYSPLCRLRVSE
jgi:hypothetical protein